MTTTPKILGFDHEISIDFLKEGDEFLAWDPYTRFFRYGVAAQDGHMVSDEYGFRSGNTYYTDHPEKNYINVKWADMTYAWPYNPYSKAETESEGHHNGPNSTIYEAKTNFVILVKEDVYQRAWDDMAINNQISRKETLMAEALAEVETAQAALEKAKKKVQEANRL